MDEGRRGADGGGEGGTGIPPVPEGSRLQQPGEGATTRFGMEEGDNTDTPVTGAGLLEEDEEPAEDRDA
jgi:hypothetical protein